MDMNAGDCRTYVLNDGFAEGVHNRHGSLAGRCAIGVWLISEEMAYNGAKSGSFDRCLRVAWRGIPAI